MDVDNIQANEAPNVIRYDYGYWAADGQRIVVSGHAPDGQVVYGFVNRDGGNPQLVGAGALGLGWIQDAVEGPGGVVMLGSPGGPGGPLRIYDGNGRALTDFLGDAAPTSVNWSCDRSAVDVLTANGRRFIARTNGRVTEITGQIGLSQAANWACAGLPPGAQTGSLGDGSAPSGGIPSGVIAGSRYEPGQQLRVYVDVLNVRSDPTTSAENVIATLVRGDFVAILAGPYHAEGHEWWRVQIASGIVGWVAGTINGADAIGP